MNLRLFYFSLIYTLLLLEGCHKPKKLDPPGVFLFNRHWGSNNGVPSYFDIVYINNYHDKSITIDSFFKMAKIYVDTVKTTIPVKGVIFMGGKTGHALPSTRSEDEDETAKKYLLGISINYKSVGKNSRDDKPSTLALYKTGQRYPDIYLDIHIPDEKIMIDSLLKLKEPYSNGF